MIKSYDTMPVGKYLELVELMQSSKSELEKQVSTIAILNDMTENEVENLPLKEYQSLSAELDFLKKPLRHAVLKNEYKIGKYNLVVVAETDKMKTDQYIDFQELSKKEKTNETFLDMLVIFLIPKGHKYDDDSYDLNDLRETIKEHMPIVDANAVYAFFLGKSMQLIKATLIYSRRVAKSLPREERKKVLEEIKILEDILSDGAGFIG